MENFGYSSEELFEEPLKEEKQIKSNHKKHKFIVDSISRNFYYAKDEKGEVVAFKKDKYKDLKVGDVIPES